VFGRAPSDPFIPPTVRSRALKAWAAKNTRRLKDSDRPDDVRILEPVALHEARHCAVTYLSSAGIDPLQVMF